MRTASAYAKGSGDALGVAVSSCHHEFNSRWRRNWLGWERMASWVGDQKRLRIMGLSIGQPESDVNINV
jgi:hypothetical protein